MCQDVECGCEHHGRKEHYGSDYGRQGGCETQYPPAVSCACGCEHHGFGMGRRHFVSKEEIVTGLETYLKQLRAEAAGVEEHISELKKGQP